MNMNAMGDDHVSFSASHLAVSPCKRYLLVSTDGSRIIMFRTRGDTTKQPWHQLSFCNSCLKLWILGFGVVVLLPMCISLVTCCCVCRLDSCCCVCRLDADQEFLRTADRDEVPSTLHGLASERALHFCCCGSWHRICLPCSYNKGSLLHQSS